MRQDSAHLHAVVMAGGSGTRFWPLSRGHLPKQFLALTGEKSLLRETFERLAPLTGPEQLWVVAGQSHVERVSAELPEIPYENIIGEPVGRNTAPCIGVAARRVLRRDPDARLLVSPADHFVHPAKAFRQTVLDGLKLLDSISTAAAEPWTVTFGIVPRYPATGFGYIERGEVLGSESQRSFRVARFQEKPALDVARNYVASGRFYWNSGIFLWTAAGLFHLIETYLPALAAGIAAIDERAAGPGGLEAALAASFASLPGISIDYGVLEHAVNTAVVAADFEWDDVGSWLAVERYGRQDAEGNSIVGQHLGVDTRRSIVVSQGRLVATVGVEDLVIVETADAVLVCGRNATEGVRKIVERLRQEGRGDLA